MKKDELAFESFKINQDLIKFIDQKASIVLVIFGALTTIYLNVVNSLALLNPFRINGFFNLIHPILLFALTASLLLTLVILIYVLIFKVILPRYASHYKKDEISLIYFDHISKLARDDYISSFLAQKDDDILNSLLAQNYELSNIITIKQKFLSITIKLLFYSIIQLLLLALIKLL